MAQYTHIVEKHNQENFPVASLLLPRSSRGDILAFYAFARGADDIADDPVLSGKIRLEQLEELKEALRFGEVDGLPAWARSYSRLVSSNRVSARHGDDLLSAFMQDTRQHRYHSLDDLMHYCRRSAAPVGRAVLELCGEERADIAAADALCNALQILNHIQDCGKDYRVLDRIYLPQEWLHQAGVTEKAFLANSSDPALRGVFDRLLDHCEALIAQSQRLFPTMHRRRIRLEVGVIWQIAQILSKKLRDEDPLARRVTLRPGDKIKAFWLALKQEYVVGRG